ncbi:MAG: YicC family protein [Deltaproteobacteria bacterium]|nr:YicC family protein [Deltaproteobacteria bacterium]
MIRSMTAFAHAQASMENKTVTVEIRSVNHKNLELSVRLPRTHSALEDRVKTAVKACAGRGKVDVSVDIASNDGLSRPYSADTALARSWFCEATAVREALGIEEPVTLAQVLRAEGVLARSFHAPDPEADWPAVSEALIEAVNTFCAMRTTEGEALWNDVEARLDFISSLLDDIEYLAKDQPIQNMERFAQRMNSLLSDSGLPADNERIAQEAAFWADKGDITEEIVRARSHIAQFTALSEKSEPCGRTLNFLCQELAREFSTMGAKSHLAPLSHTVVDAKSELEKIREQIQNIE